ncbi:MAG TPA: PP2C family serine/threonine-protein phosphatase [Pseudonocardia sp.]|nr:PP2C family serine/threonine-protein phosphatase [Pseudonocardia sp.]
MDCPECEKRVPDTDRQCGACGGDVRARRGGTADSVAPAAEPCQRCGAPAPTGVAAEYCAHCGLRRRDGSDRVDTDLGAIGGVSDRGLVHARNEDAMALGLRSPAGAAAVLCDGVSTVRTPELAARAAVEAALDVLLADEDGAAGDSAGAVSSNAAIRLAAATGDRLVREAVGAAAAAVDALGETGDRDAPSCTLVCGRVDYPAGVGSAPVITVGWVGDSRAYWLADPGGAEPSQLLTTDHSWATVMIESGRLDRETALADRRAHAITRWLGQGGEPEPEVLSWRPEGPGVLLLCSDGLWNYLPGADELAAALPPPELGASPVLIARHLTELALDAGGRDNITVVVIPVPMDR